MNKYKITYTDGDEQYIRMSEFLAAKTEGTLLSPKIPEEKITDISYYNAKDIKSITLVEE